MKKIGIIVPVYNMEKYLKQCLDSLLKQTLSEIEIICINDGSTDNSKDILFKYKKKNTCIKVIEQTNQGVAAARNAGLKEATTEYVCFMDPDDFYPDEFVLEDLYNAAKINNALICGGSFSRYNDNTGEVSTKFDGFYQKYTFDKNEMISYCDYQYDYGYHRFIYSLSMLKENNIIFPAYKRFQDPPFFVKAMLTAKEFYALKRITYCYRVGHQKINWNAERVIDFLKGISEDLKLSSENQLETLHTITVQRIIEHKSVIEKNKLEKVSEEYQRALFETLLLIRSDLLEKCNYEIDENKLFLMLKNSLILSDDYMRKIDDWKYQYDCIYNSKTFKIGKVFTLIPKKIISLINKKH